MPAASAGFPRQAASVSEWYLTGAIAVAAVIECLLDKRCRRGEFAGEYVRHRPGRRALAEVRPARRRRAPAAPRRSRVDARSLRPTVHVRRIPARWQAQRSSARPAYRLAAPSAHELQRHPHRFGTGARAAGDPIRHAAQQNSIGRGSSARGRRRRVPPRPPSPVRRVHRVARRTWPRRAPRDRSPAPNVV